ncbi:MAG: hypothetical protein HUJ55_00370 [Ileibacterium sp.]|nr:hypothetical protein [Ileibacterium sp.]
MNDTQILNLARQERSHPGKLARIYLYTSMSGTRNSSLEELTDTLCALSGLSRRQFERECQIESRHWSEKIEDASAFIAGSDWMKKWIGRCEARFGKKDSYLHNVEVLMVWLLCTTLQNASIAQYKNLLKEKYILQLFELLDSSEHLKPVFGQIEKPIRDVIKGRCTPTSSSYLDRSLAIVHLLSSYFQFTLTGRTLAALTARDFLSQVNKWSSAQLLSFCSPNPDLLLKAQPDSK